MSKKIDLYNLPVGTLIFVENGYWYGKIVHIDGNKCLEVQSNIGYITHEISKNAEYELYGTSKILPETGKYNVVIRVKGEELEPFKIETKLTISNHTTYKEIKDAVKYKVKKILDSYFNHESEISYSFSFDYDKCWMGETL